VPSGAASGGQILVGGFRWWQSEAMNAMIGRLGTFEWLAVAVS
jgi:hypothetical protein